MRAFLTKHKSLSTRETRVLSDIQFPQRAHFISKLYDRVKTGLAYVPHEASYAVATSDIVDYVHNNPVDGKTGFLFAAGSQSWAGGKIEVEDTKSELDYNFKLGVISVTNIFAGMLAAKFSAHDYVSTDASTCASGIKCLAEAKHLIDHLGFDRVIIVAVEDQLARAALNFFGQSKANLLLADENAGRIPSAFDSKNSGFILGHGAGLCIIESENAINKNAVKPEAELLSAHIAAEQSINAIGQRPDGQGYQRAILGALMLANKNPEDITLVKTHGTGTAVNNVAEKNGIQSVLTNFIATSYKQHIGHTLGASSILETSLILDDIKSGVIPAIKNRTEDDAVFISKDTTVPDTGLLLSLAAGMGNVYGAALFDHRI